MYERKGWIDEIGWMDELNEGMNGM